MNIKIARATPADSTGIADVQITSYRTAYARFFPPSYFEQMTEAEQTQDWIELMQAHGKTVIFLWTIEGNPVRAFYDRLGGSLAGEQEYDVDNATITKVAYSWADLDDLRAKLYLHK